MKKKIFTLMKYIVSSLALVAMFAFAYLVLSSTFKIDEIDEGDSFHNLPNNSMDVIVIGSSHAQFSFSPQFFYQETGLYSYVLGTSCQPLDVAYSMAKEALKTQSPKAIVLEVFTAMPLRSGCDGISCYISAGFQMRGKEKYETLKKLPKEKYDTYVNPFISSHNNWRTIDFDVFKESIFNTVSLLQRRTDKDLSKINYMLGYRDNYPSFPVVNSWFANTTDNYIDVELKENDLNALNNMYELCKENNIELVLYKTPIDGLDIENLSYLKRVWEWADERNIQYVDYVKESPKIDFQMWLQSDSFHSYINGASLITSDLASLFNEKQIIHTVNDDLEKIYHDASNHLSVKYFKTEYDPHKYSVRMFNFQGPVLIVYNGSEVYTGMIRAFLDKYNIQGPSIVFADNGQVIERSDTDLSINYMNNYIYSDYEYMEIKEEGQEINCGLSVVFFSSDMNDYYKLDTNLDNSWKNGYSWYGE